MIYLSIWKLFLLQYSYSTYHDRNSFIDKFIILSILQQEWAYIYFHTNTQNSKYDKFTQNKLFLFMFLKVIITFEWSLWCAFVLELLSLSLVCVCVYSSKNKMLMFLLCGRKKHQKKMLISLLCGRMQCGPSL